MRAHITVVTIIGLLLQPHSASSEETIQLEPRQMICQSVSAFLSTSWTESGWFAIPHGCQFVDRPHDATVLERQVFRYSGKAYIAVQVGWSDFTDSGWSIYRTGVTLLQLPQNASHLR